MPLPRAVPFRNSTGTVASPTTTTESDINRSGSAAHLPMITAPPPNYFAFPSDKYGPPSCYYGAEVSPADIENQTIPNDQCPPKEKVSGCYIWPSCTV